MNNTLALPSLVSLAGLLVVVAYLYRTYRVDLFRQRLFAIRDGLFDRAATGRIAFDNPAYGALRVTLNGFIRFGDRLSVPWLLALSVLLKHPEQSATVTAYDRRWKDGLAMLPAEEQKALLAVQRELHNEVTKQVICASPLFTLCVLLPVGIVVVLIAMRETVIHEIKSRTQPRADAAAYAEGCLA